MKTVMVVTVDWNPEYNKNCEVPVSSKLANKLLDELKSTLGCAVESWDESCTIELETPDDDDLILYPEVNDYDVKNILELKRDKNENN